MLKKKLLTESCGTEGGPTVDETPVTGDNSSVHSITNHHEVPPLLLDLHVLMINPFLYVNHVTPHAVLWGRQHCVHDLREIPTPILSHYNIRRDTPTSF